MGKGNVRQGMLKQKFLKQKRSEIIKNGEKKKKYLTATNITKITICTLNINELKVHRLQIEMVNL